MTAALKIPPRLARRLRDYLATRAIVEAEARTLLQEMAPRRKTRKVLGLPGQEDRRAERKAEKVKVRREVRDACAARANGRCESCRSWEGPELEMDHFWGRAREESMESCWMLCRQCHRSKTDNRPTRIFWLRVFGQHCETLGYSQQQIKVGAAVMLETAQHPEARSATTRTT